MEAIIINSYGYKNNYLSGVIYDWLTINIDIWSNKHHLKVINQFINRLNNLTPKLKYIELIFNLVDGSQAYPGTGNFWRGLDWPKDNQLIKFSNVPYAIKRVYTNHRAFCYNSKLPYKCVISQQQEDFITEQTPKEIKIISYGGMYNVNKPPNEYVQYKRELRYNNMKRKIKC